MNHLMKMVAASLLLVAGCTDPTAVQKFAQSAPPSAQFNALLLDYPGLLIQEPMFNNIVAERNVTPPPSVDATAFCSNISALNQLHAAMVAYMNALGAAATAGTAVKSASSGGGAATAGNADAPPANPPAGPPLCPPTTMPVVVAAQAAPAAGPAGAAAGAGGQALTASTLSTDLQNLFKIPGLTISKTDADAASSLVILIEDAATDYLREQAVKDALSQGHDGFLSALAIEKTVIGFVATTAQLYAGGLQADISGVSRSVGNGDARSQRVALDVATRMLLELSPTGPIANPQQALEIQSAAQAYVTALDNLKTAYIKLSDTSTSGANVLTAATWTAIQPLLTDVANAYTAVSKL